MFHNLLSGKLVLMSLMLLTDTPNGGTLWFRYMRALTATTRVPPSGFLTGMACVQSNGKFDMDHMMGCTFCWMLRDIATMAHVSWRTAMRLKNKGPLLSYFNQQNALIKEQ